MLHLGSGYSRNVPVLVKLWCSVTDSDKRNGWFEAGTVGSLKYVEMLGLGEGSLHTFFLHYHVGNQAFTG